MVFAEVVSQSISQVRFAAGVCKLLERRTDMNMWRVPRARSSFLQF